jgi:hypothetical protein
MNGRLGAVLIVAVAMTLAACSAGPAPPSAALDERAAIRDVLVSGIADTSPPTFPDRPARISCVIQGGGPYPGIRVPGSCQTSAGRIGSLFVVTLTEFWEATEFHGGDVDPAQGRLSHAWQYEVDGAGHVTLVDSFGNFPPQEAY